MFKLLFRLGKGIVFCLITCISVSFVVVIIMIMHIELLTVNESDSIIGKFLDKYVHQSQQLITKFKEWGE